MEILIIYTLLVILTFFTRIFIRFFRRDARDTDTWYHLLSAERIRENHFKIPLKLKGALLPSIYDYPPLLHYFFSLFPKDKREKIEPYFGPIVDTLCMSIIFLFSFLLAKNISIEPKKFAFLSALIYIFTPLMYDSFTGPRVFTATPRILSELLFYLCMFFMWLFFTTNIVLFLLIAIFFSALLLLSSKFGTQVLFFFSIIISCFFGNIFFLLLPISSFILAIIFSKGHYWKVLTGHIKHLIFYSQCLSKSHIAVKDRNRLKNILELPKDIFKDRKKAFRTIFERNTYLNIAIRNPFLILLIVLIIINPDILWSKFHFFLFWIIASVVCFFITSLRPFLFLGEAERYCEYSMPALCIILSFWLIELNQMWQWYLFWALILFSIILITIRCIILLLRTHPKAEHINLTEIVNFLKEMPEPQQILVIPVIDSYMFSYKTNHYFLYFSGNVRENLFSKEEYNKLFAVFPFVSSCLEKIISKYQINAIICRKRALKTADREGIKYDFSSYKKIFESETFIVYDTSVIY